MRIAKKIVSLTLAAALAGMALPAYAEPVVEDESASSYENEAADASPSHAEGEAVVLYLPASGPLARNGGADAGPAALEAEGFTVKRDFDVSVDAATAEENGLADTLGNPEVAAAILDATEGSSASAAAGFANRFAVPANDAEEFSADEAAFRAVFERARIAVVSKPGASTAELIDELEGQDGVLIAEPNYLLTLDGGYTGAPDRENQATALADGQLSDDQGFTAVSDASSALSAPLVPDQTAPGLAASTNDPAAGNNLWSLFGQNGIGMDSALEAIDAAAPDPVVVAVADTGVDYNHPDLKESMWVNPGDIGLPGKHGYDFGCDDDDPMPDLSYHGTHVAGIIAATRDNGVGIVGSSGGCAQIMALKMDDADNERVTYTDAGIASYQYVLQAKKAGVNVVAINNSWGDWGGSLILEYLIDQLGKAGVVSVFATGNSSQDVDAVPSLAGSSTSPYLLSISAGTSRGDLASFSNYGAANADVAFPGQDVLSTYPLDRDTFKPPAYLPSLVGQAVVEPGDEVKAGQGANYFYTSFSNASLDMFKAGEVTSSGLVPLDPLDRLSLESNTGYAENPTLRIKGEKDKTIAVAFRIENPFYGVAPESIPADVRVGLSATFAPGSAATVVAIVSGGMKTRLMVVPRVGRSSFGSAKVAVIDPSVETVTV